MSWLPLLAEFLTDLVWSEADGSFLARAEVEAPQSTPTRAHPPQPQILPILHDR